MSLPVSSNPNTQWNSTIRVAMTVFGDLVHTDGLPSLTEGGPVSGPVVPCTVPPVRPTRENSIPEGATNKNY